MQNAGRDWLFGFFGRRQLRHATCVLDFHQPTERNNSGSCPTLLRRTLVSKPSEDTMLRWAVIFLIVAIIAGALGVSGAVVGTAAWIAKVLFVIFIVLFLIGLISGRRGPTV